MLNKLLFISILLLFITRVAADTTISANCTWNSSTTFDGNVFINSNVTITLTGDITLPYALIVPENNTLTLTSSNGAKLTAEYIGGKKGAYDNNNGRNGEQSGDIIITGCNISAEYIGGGLGGGSLVNGGQGGKSGNITITNSYINLSDYIGGGRGASVDHWGAAGKGGDCKNINVTNSAILCSNLGPGKGGKKQSFWFADDGKYLDDASATYTDSFVFAKEAGTNIVNHGNFTLLFDMEVILFDEIRNLITPYLSEIELKGQTITIPEGKTLTIKGKITGNGTIAGKGTLRVISKDGTNGIGDNITVNTDVKKELYYVFKIASLNDGRSFNSAPTLYLKGNNETIYERTGNSHTNFEQFYTVPTGNYTIIIGVNIPNEKGEPTDNWTITGGKTAIKTIDATTPVKDINFEYYTVNFNLNGGGIGESTPSNQIIEKGRKATAPSTSSITRQYYTCGGWYDGDTPLADKTITGKTTFSIRWIPNEFKVSTPNGQILKYKVEMKEYDLSTLVSKDVAEKCGSITSYESNSLPAGLSLDRSTGKITGTPIAATNKVSVPITIKAQNSYQVTVNMDFTVQKSATSISSFPTTLAKNYDGKPIGIEAPKVTSETATDTDEISSTLFFYKRNEADPLPGAPTDAGQYIVKANYSGDQNHAASTEVSADFEIKPLEITITPDADQFIYADEKESVAPIYKYSGNVADETPAFSGKLAWGGSVITKGNLALTDGNGFRADNYTLSVVENVSYTSHSGNLSDAVASPSTEASHEGKNGWYTATVTLTAPTDFKIKSATAPELRSADDWTATTITFDDEGEYTAWYQLKRDGRETPNDPKSIDIKLDKTAPAIGTIQAAGSSFTLSLTDEASGIATIAYTLNGDAEVEVSSGFAPGDKAYTLNIPAGYGEHTVSVTVADRAGLSTTASRNITLTDPTPPIDPTPPVDPAPTVYYTVTLPAVEGATTNPVAGEYEVGAWDSFRFYLLLGDEYDRSVPVVTTSRGETIVPRSSDGAYVVKQVRNDVELFIAGIVRNDSPVANKPVDAGGTKVWTAGGHLYLLSATDDRAFIFTADGTLHAVQSLHAGEEQVLQLQTGVYIIRIGNHSYKVVI